MHNIININGLKEREKTIVGLKGSKKISIATKLALNISKKYNPLNIICLRRIFDLNQTIEI